MLKETLLAFIAQVTAFINYIEKLFTDLFHVNHDKTKVNVPLGLERFRHWFFASSLRILAKDIIVNNTA